MKFIYSLLALMISLSVFGQSDSLSKTLSIGSDFRFRIEHDWNSKRSDGSFRDDRSRLRYRFRFGVHYQLNEWASFGGRMRSGNINDQQGPHVTLGGKNGEFGLTQIGLEKLFFQYSKKRLIIWVGKNDLLAHKQNELFWNDNVFPEGIAAKLEWPIENSKWFNMIALNTGHYIIRSNNKTFDKDSYFQLLQLITRTSRTTLFPSLYYFKDVGNIPDQQEEFVLSYKIFHLGASTLISRRHNINVGLDYYTNFQDYNNNDAIINTFKNETQGLVLNAKIGDVKSKGNWLVHLYYAYLQKYAVVDYFAQNDWARWDYSSYDAFGARLTNMKGFELRIGYALDDKLNLILRAYVVEQIKAEGLFRETGDRIRLDLNIKI